MAELFLGSLRCNRADVVNLDSLGCTFLYRRSVEDCVLTPLLFVRCDVEKGLNFVAMGLHFSAGEHFLCIFEWSSFSWACLDSTQC